MGWGKRHFTSSVPKKCIRLNIPGTKEHAERKQASQGWVGPDLLLPNPEIANNLKRPMLNDPEAWLLGGNPKRLYGDTITNVRNAGKLEMTEMHINQRMDEETGLIK